MAIVEIFIRKKSSKCEPLHCMIFLARRVPRSHTILYGIFWNIHDVIAKIEYTKPQIEIFCIEPSVTILSCLYEHWSSREDTRMDQCILESEFSAYIQRSQCMYDLPPCSCAIFIDDISLSAYDGEFLIFLECFYLARELTRIDPYIVIIDTSNIDSSRIWESSIESSHEFEILFISEYDNPGIEVGIFLEDFSSSIRGCIINDNKFKISEILTQYRIYCFSYISSAIIGR